MSMGFWPIKCALGWGFYSRLLASMCFTPSLIVLTLLCSALKVKGMEHACAVQLCSALALLAAFCYYKPLQLFICLDVHAFI